MGPISTWTMSTYHPGKSRLLDPRLGTWSLLRSATGPVQAGWRRPCTPGTSWWWTPTGGSMPPRYTQVDSASAWSMSSTSQIGWKKIGSQSEDEIVRNLYINRFYVFPLRPSICSLKIHKTLKSFDQDTKKHGPHIAAYFMLNTYILKLQVNGQKDMNF